MTLSALTPIPSSGKSVDADVLVVAVRQADTDRVLAGDDLAVLREIGERLDASGAADVLTLVPAPEGFAAPLVAFIGLGEREPTPDGLRRAAGSAVRQLAGKKHVALALPDGDGAFLEAIFEGAALGSYSFDAFKSGEAGKAPVAEVSVVLSGDSEPDDFEIESALTVAEAVNEVRNLVNTPPRELSPAAFAEHVERRSSEVDGVEVEVWNEERLEAEGFGGILGVGAGSSRPPRLVRVSWSPEGAQKHIALIGKGITYDSGGYSLKPAASMRGMKFDMHGAASVYAAVIAAAQLQVPVRVTAWLCIAENMVSGTAIRPDDILTMYGGKTVEVTNTDAEGRLVMADGLVRAAEDQPDALIDVATLTGAQMIALGARTTGVMSNSQELMDDYLDAAEEVGEATWPMPFPPELKEKLKSDVADLVNSPLGYRYGGMLTAGTFLREFVGETPEGEPLPWLHVDIAGPSNNESGAYGYTPKGATGVAVRPIVRLIEFMADGES